MVSASVWWADAAAPARCSDLLGPDELDRVSRLVRTEDRRMFVAAHALVRLAAATVTGTEPGAVDLRQRCERCGGPHGRPQVQVSRGPEVMTSLAHAGGWVVVAIADRPVGVDVEPAGRAALDIAEVALGEDERAELDERASGDPAADLLRWWVRKEAVLKATGVGLDTDPGEVRVTPPWERPAVVDSPVPMVLADVDADPRLVVALAAMGTPPLDLSVSRWAW